MLGLIEKDLRLTLTRKQTLIIFLAIALFMGISMDGTFVIGYFTMLATIMSIGTISYDEFDNGFAFLMTLPFERKTYVREKYLLSLLFVAAAWSIGTILYCIGSVVRHNTAALADELPVMPVLIPLFYLAAAIMIPLQLKYGAEKSRLALAVIFGIIAAVIYGSTRLLDGTNILSRLAMALESISPVIALVALSGVCIIVSYVFYLLSVRIIEKKEF